MHFLDANSLEIFWTLEFSSPLEVEVCGSFVFRKSPNLLVSLRVFGARSWIPWIHQRFGGMQQPRCQLCRTLFGSSESWRRSESVNHIFRSWMWFQLSSCLDILLMVQKSQGQPPVGCFWNPANNGINYQPQLVQDFSHQQYCMYVNVYVYIYIQIQCMWVLTRGNWTLQNIGKDLPKLETGGLFLKKSGQLIMILIILMMMMMMMMMMDTMCVYIYIHMWHVHITYMNTWWAPAPMNLANCEAEAWWNAVASNGFA